MHIVLVCFIVVFLVHVFLKAIKPLLPFQGAVLLLMPVHSYLQAGHWHSHVTVHGEVQVRLYDVACLRPAQVNFFFLLNIVRVLITKLKKTHCAESTAYMKAVRATLILIPLLGIEYVILLWSPEGSISSAIYNFFIHIFSHFQVPAAQDYVLKTDTSMDLSGNLLCTLLPLTLNIIFFLAKLSIPSLLLEKVTKVFHFN